MSCSTEVCVTSNHLCLTPELTYYCLLLFRHFDVGLYKWLIRYVSSYLCGCARERVIFCTAMDTVFFCCRMKISSIIIIIKKQSQEQLHISDTVLWHNKRAVLHLFPFVLPRFICFFSSHILIIVFRKFTDTEYTNETFYEVHI